MIRWGRPYHTEAYLSEHAWFVYYEFLISVSWGIYRCICKISVYLRLHCQEVLSLSVIMQQPSLVIRVPQAPGIGAESKTFTAAKAHRILCEWILISSQFLQYCPEVHAPFNAVKCDPVIDSTAPVSSSWWHDNITFEENVSQFGLPVEHLHWFPVQADVLVYFLWFPQHNTCSKWFPFI